MPDHDDWLSANRAMWDERVPIHVGSDFYDVDGFLAGRSTLRPFELAEIGSVDGLTLVHPQCHIGLDTLSWARRGATVTGIDFSEPAVLAARELAARAGVEAEFVQASVYDAVEVLGPRRFDVVYTGIGALLWLPDIDRWARTMAELLSPGGRFYLAEFHPFTAVFSDEDLTVTESYFDRGPHIYDDPGTYADPTAPTVQNRSIEWRHGLGEVISAVVGAGLAIEFVHEHEFTLMQRWPFLVPCDNGTFRMPADMPALPLMYSLLARRQPSQGARSTTTQF